MFDFDGQLDGVVMSVAQRMGVEDTDGLLSDAKDALREGTVNDMDRVPPATVQIRDFLTDLPSERRQYAFETLAAMHIEQVGNKRYIDQQITGMYDIPRTVYKYIPLELLQRGHPYSLRVTQPSALNDPMEANIATLNNRRLDRDQWRTELQEFTLEHLGNTFQEEEWERRMRLFGDPRISTLIRDKLDESVGVVSFSEEPLHSLLWAHYARNSGVVVGYDAKELSRHGSDLKKVLYLELAPQLDPARDNIVRASFVDEQRRARERAERTEQSGTPIMGSADLFELTDDWRALSAALFVKGSVWSYEREVRLLIEQGRARVTEEKDEEGWPILLLDLPANAIREVYVSPSTPKEVVTTTEKRIREAGTENWTAKYISWHANRLEVTMTFSHK